MSNNFNPFARSKRKIVEPLQLVSCAFDGWTQTYTIEYRATRSAAQIGLLQKQFKTGTPLVVHGKHVVVREANFTHSNNTVDEVTIRVSAVDFALVLAGLQPGVPATPASPDATIKHTGLRQDGPFPKGQPPASIPGALRIPGAKPGRRILL